MRTKRGNRDVDTIYKHGDYEYTGVNVFRVNHPDYKSSIVAAPDADSAMVAAAEHWGVRWQALNFYSRCEVFKG